MVKAAWGYSRNGGIRRVCAAFLFVCAAVLLYMPCFHHAVRLYTHTQGFVDENDYFPVAVVLGQQRDDLAYIMYLSDYKQLVFRRSRCTLVVRQPAHVATETHIPVLGVVRRFHRPTVAVRKAPGGPVVTVEAPWNELRVETANYLVQGREVVPISLTSYFAPWVQFVAATGASLVALLLGLGLLRIWRVADGLWR